MVKKLTYSFSVILLILVLVLPVYEYLPGFSGEGSTAFIDTLPDKTLDRSVRFVIKPNYRKVDRLVNGLIAVKKDGDWGYINDRGDTVIPMRFSGARRCSESLCAVSSNNRWGYLDRSGEWVIEPKYSAAMPFSSGRAAVKRKKHWAFINNDGETVTEFRFDGADQFYGNRALVTVGDRKGFIALDGRMVIAPEYSDAGSFRNSNYAPVEKYDLWGYVNRSGSLQIDYRYQWASPFRGSIARVLQQGSWSYLHKNGVRTPSLPEQLVFDFQDGLARTFNDRKISFIDTGLASRISPGYSQALSFRQGLAPAKEGGLWGYIDSKGDWIINPTFEAADQFQNGLAAVKVNGGWGFIKHPGIESESLAKNGSIRNVKIRKGLSLADPIDINESFLNYVSRFDTATRDQYVNIGIGLQTRHWNRKQLETDTSYGQFAMTTEVTKYPYDEPGAYELEKAELLFWSSLKSAIENNWFDFEVARKDGFGDYAIQNHHYLHKRNILDGRVLVPGRPENLIFKTVNGEKRLVGFMYLLKSSRKSGPQIGGPLTLWHYHVWNYPRCFHGGFLLDSRTSTCTDGEWKIRSSEMLHVWFIDNPQGTFATRMDFPPGTLPDYAERYKPMNK